MKAAVYPGKGADLVIADLPDPAPAPHQVVIAVDRCGICGTDLAMTRGATWDYAPGSQLGHEYAGTVVARGRDVATLAVGDRVAVLPSGACGHCHGCSQGNHVMCREAGPAGGGFAQFAALDAALAVPLPRTLSLADGALVEPLAVSLYGVRKSPMRKGDDVLVLGGGTVALYAIYWARRLGAGKIVALSRSERRRDLCLAMGADAFVTAGADEVAQVQAALGGHAPAVVFECAGASGLLMQGVNHVANYGTVVSLGFCTAPDPVMPAVAAYKCATIQFLVGYRMEEFTFIADQLDKGHIDPGLIISSTVPLADLPATFAALRGPNAETKVHVLM